MMSLVGSFGGVFILVYVLLFAAIIGALYWIMRYFRQLTRVNEVKEKILHEKFRNMTKKRNQSSSETS